jgi:hypothetical protein
MSENKYANVSQVDAVLSECKKGAEYQQKSRWSVMYFTRAQVLDTW